MAVVDRSAGGVSGVGDRSAPEFGVVEALRRHWRLALAPVVVCVAIGVALALSYKPVYTAQTRLSVGRLTVTQQATPGFATGALQLAVAYARDVTADQVVVPVAKALNLPVGQVRGHLNASPVPLAPVLIVEATSRTGPGAVDLANAASKRLVAFEKAAAGSNPVAKSQLRKFRIASRKLNDRSVARRAAAADYAASHSAENRQALSKAKASESAAKLEAQSIQDAFLRSQGGTDLGSQVRVLNPARVASNDRSSHGQALVFGALVIGLLLGIALAVSRSRAAVRRAMLQR